MAVRDAQLGAPPRCGTGIIERCWHQHWRLRNRSHGNKLAMTHRSRGAGSLGAGAWELELGAGAWELEPGSWEPGSWSLGAWEAVPASSTSNSTLKPRGAVPIPLVEDSRQRDASWQVEFGDRAGETGRALLSRVV